MHPIYPIWPKTHVWCVFAVLVLADRTRAKPAPMGRSSYLWSEKNAVDFFETNAPNPPRLTQNSCLVCFRSFCFGRQNSCETRTQGPFWPLVEQINLQLIFSKRMHPIYPVWCKTHVGVFLQFWFRSTKLVRNLPPWAVLATCGAKKLTVDFFETHATNPPR
jgi:hypothetical protein